MLYHETKLGKLYHGDCLEIMKNIQDKSIDMILCDLPYGTTRCNWDVIIPFECLWEQYERIIKDNGAIVLFGSQPFTSLLVNSNIKLFRYEWIWEKQKASNFMSAKKNPLKYHENILVFYKNQPTYNYQKYDVVEIETIMNYSKKEMLSFLEKREYDKFAKIDRRNNVNDQTTNKDHLGNAVKRNRSVDDGKRFPKSVIKINKSINKNVHPTQKPIALCEYLIRTYTNELDTVLDNTCGSGTTPVACENLNRKWVGIEKEQEYCDITVARLKEED